MGYRKFFSFLISIIMVVAMVSSTVLADGPDEGEGNGEGNSFTTVSGITLTLPPEYEHVIWPGIAEDDPNLKELGIDKDTVTEMYTKGGVEIQSGNSKYPIFFIVFENDVPNDINREYLDNVFPMFPDAYGTTEIFGYGVEEINGIPFYRIAHQSSGDTRIRLNQYSILTGSGRMHQIDIMLFGDYGITSSEPEPFTDEECARLNEVTESIISSIKLSDELAADVVRPDDAEPFKMAIGDYTPSADVEGSGAVSAEAGQTDANTDATSQAGQEESVPSKAPTFFKFFTSINIPTYVILIALVLVLFLGSRLSKRHEWQEEPLSLDKAKAVQGFAAVAVILHHLAQELAGNAGAIGFFNELGVLFVGIFFFFSGYGLYTSLNTKENYLKGFLKKRFVTILIPFYMCIIVFTVAACICGTKFNPVQLLCVLSGWSLINANMWYIVEIAILYIAFFLIYRLIKNRTAATVVMSIFVIAMITGSFLLAHGDDMSSSYWFQGEWWYNSTLLFVIGIIFSRHSDVIRKIARKGYVILLPVFAVLTVLFGLQTNYALGHYSYWSEIPGVDPAYMDKLRCLSLQLPFVIFFVCFVLLAMMKVRFGNPVLKFLGSISLELYLIHYLILTGLHDGTIFRVKDPGMYCILSILISVGLATVISGVDKYLIALITGKKKAVADPALKINSHIHSIDVMRIVMAFLVIAIHFPFDGKAGEVFFTYGKTAVPFFLVVCGYFLYRDDTKEMMKRLLKQTKRIFIFFVAANAFYALFYAIYLRVTEGSFAGMKDTVSSKALIKFLLYNFSPYSEHLWYLGSLLYALLIMLLLNKLKALKGAMFAAPLLVAAYVVLSHLGIGESYQLRNAILVGLGYTMMGMLIRRFGRKVLDHKFTAPVLWIMFIICCVTAIFELNGYKLGIEVPFVSCEILVYLIMLLCLKYPNFGKDTFAEWLGRECSLPVYILHIAVGYLIFITGNDGFFGKYAAIVIFVTTTVIAALYKNIKKAITSGKQ
ncbi:MAG: acyltransferase [Clostridiales bacterium]|nr:acyltransferase [Clostridiales bacterium]